MWEGKALHLPHANLLADIQEQVQKIKINNNKLKHILPNLFSVDLFMLWDDNKYMILISDGKKADLPRRGMDKEYIAEHRNDNYPLFEDFSLTRDVSESDEALSLFEQLNYLSGFSAIGECQKTNEYSFDTYEEGRKVANLMEQWAERKRQALENSKIFLSHSGANKTLIGKVDEALRMLGLKTWFSRDDLPAGSPLIRTIHQAFPECAAAVFFISGEFKDAAIIGNEINVALTEEAQRNKDFKIIPLVLSQHGGNDSCVPVPLRHLAWSSVTDVEVVPKIVCSLPPALQRLVRFTPLK